MGHPGKRAPTVELCNDQASAAGDASSTSLGPYPFDPNLIARASRPTTASTSTTGSTRRSRARRCRQALSRRARRPMRRRRVPAAPLGASAGARCGPACAAAAGQLAQRGAHTGGPACRSAAGRGAVVPPAGEGPCRRRRVRSTASFCKPADRRSRGALRPAHGRVHDARRSDAAADESGRRTARRSRGRICSRSDHRRCVNGRAGDLLHPTGISMSRGLLMPHAPLSVSVMLRPARRSVILRSRSFRAGLIPQTMNFWWPGAKCRRGTVPSWGCRGRGSSRP